ncbi:MAG TPA: hypothetical protein VNA23_11510 [Anaerolineales bacterium]|nr:hypothetical protein [Anaerolineales bacterium]
MLTKYHIEILSAALAGCFSSRALAAISKTNVNQDRLRGLLGHDEFHFDNNAFERSYAYMEEQRALIASALKTNQAASAWSAFGRLTHTAHDFYAHSNYITLWLSRLNGETHPLPAEVDPVDLTLLNSPDLRSGKVYYPLEILYYIRPLRQFALSHIPRDSHAWMNLDSPEQGFKFDYAMQAALKRTKIEFDKTTLGFSEEMCRLFLDK